MSVSQSPQAASSASPSPAPAAAAAAAPAAPGGPPLSPGPAGAAAAAAAASPSPSPGSPSTPIATPSVGRLSSVRDGRQQSFLGLGQSPRRKNSLEQNITEMKMPTQLLKFGKTGKGFRLFQLTPTLDGLMWLSKNKSAAKTKVLFKDVKEIRFGQRTEKFRRNNRPDLDHLSFSLIYVENGLEDTLDLVCKDEEEFQTWTRTLQSFVDSTVPPELMDRLKSSVPAAAPTPAKQASSKLKKQEIFQGANDIYVFGWGERGQNGIGEARNSPTPQLVETMLGKGVLDVACGWAHTVVLLEGGSVVQYGNHVGTGLEHDYDVPTPTKIPERIVIAAIACGTFHSAALTDKGQVLTWGCNLNGELGHGDVIDRSEPTLVKALEGGEDVFIEDLACGSNFTACLASDGKLFTWGCNDRGMLGHNDLKERHLPEIVKDLVGTDIVKVVCGDYHMFACTKNEVYGWGWNGCGQLGLNSEEDQHRPTVLESLRGNQVASISCGAAHTVAVVVSQKLKQRVLYAWGSNANGQLGHGKKKRVLKPSPVPELKDVVIAEVACGSTHTAIRTEDGEVYTCGQNKYGQLGHGNNSNLDTFRLVEALKGKNPRQLSCGGENTQVLIPRAWVEDKEAKECMSCKQAFTFVIRKHHCRNCGGIFCSTCSAKKIAILKYGLTEPVRVCTSCYTKLGGR